MEEVEDILPESIPEEPFEEEIEEMAQPPLKRANKLTEKCPVRAAERV